MPTRKDEEQEQVHRDVRPPETKKKDDESQSVPPPDQRTWTRGNDPDAAAQSLLEANRGTTGGEYNAGHAPRTPQGDQP